MEPTNSFKEGWEVGTHCKQAKGLAKVFICRTHGSGQRMWRLPEGVGWGTGWKGAKGEKIGITVIS